MARSSSGGLGVHSPNPNADLAAARRHLGRYDGYGALRSTPNLASPARERQSHMAATEHGRTMVAPLSSAARLQLDGRKAAVELRNVELWLTTEAVPADPAPTMLWRFVNEGANSGQGDGQVSHFAPSDIDYERLWQRLQQRGKSLLGPSERKAASAPIHFVLGNHHDPSAPDIQPEGDLQRIRTQKELALAIDRLSKVRLGPRAQTDNIQLRLVACRRATKSNPPAAVDDEVMATPSMPMQEDVDMSRNSIELAHMEEPAAQSTSSSDEEEPAAQSDVEEDEVAALDQTPDVLEDYWESACNFFRHDKAIRSPETKVHIAGLAKGQGLWPVQLTTLYIWLFRCFGEQDGTPTSYNGHILALDTGLGKTIVSIAAFVVLNLVNVLKDAIATHMPNIAEENLLSVVCSYADVIGLRCACAIKDGRQRLCLLRMIAAKAGSGPGLFFVPAATKEGFARLAASYVARNLTLTLPNGPEYETRFVQVYSDNTTRDKDGNGCRKLSEFDKRWKASPTTRPALRKNQGRWGNVLAAAGEEYTVTAVERKTVLNQAYPLVVISQDGTGLKNQPIFNATVQMRATKSTQARSITIPWCVVPSLIVQDELHKVKTHGTSLHTIMRALVSQCNDQRPRYMGLSATPITTSLESSLSKPVCYCIPDGWDVTAPTFGAKHMLKEVVPSIDKYAKLQADDDKREEYVTRLEELRELLGRIMTKVTATTKFFDEGLVVMPPWASKEDIACSSNFRTTPAFQQHADQFKRDWAQEKKRNHLGEQSDGQTVEQKRAEYRLRSMSRVYHLMRLCDSFPGFVLLPPGPGNRWVGLDPKKTATAEERKVHPINGYIKRITGLQPYGGNHEKADNGKLTMLCRILDKALADDSLPVDGSTVQGPWKKHVAVWTPHPAAAVAIAAYADHELARHWKIVLITANDCDVKKRQEIIGGAFGLVARGDETCKPTLLITTVGACGTGLNGFQHASYGVLFDIPLSEMELVQVPGRIRRPGQIHRPHFYTLWALGGQAEPNILPRARTRNSTWDGVQGGGL